ncbi:helix-turn-helix domain-containing protein [Vibrio maerlii]|uniref:helix-turn-helix domain-containing protein n=1 Tax=Vibrio maerlii TaxID=2231648 RepID=UPI000E3CE5E2|nr:helix-turn-helix domain-containing protein [Vibrio maerlii]
MYKQLSPEQRVKIWALKKSGKSQTQIANELAIHRSTVSRELNRNAGPYGYEPQLAQRLASYRKKHHQQAYEIEYKDLIAELRTLGLDPQGCKRFIFHHHPELMVEQVDKIFELVSKDVVFDQ